MYFCNLCPPHLCKSELLQACTGINWVIKNSWMGLPWQHSRWESVCQCRAHGFIPRSGKIPHAVGKLALCFSEPAPQSHNCWARVPQLLNPERPAAARWNHWAPVLQLLKPGRLEPVFCNKRSHRNERPTHHNKEQSLLDAARESPHTAVKT